jgi:fermentation-respiration switch protein FrsA (DUF1100 family)
MTTVRHSIRNENEIPGGRRLTLYLESNDDRLPGVLLLPAAQPAPAALLLHGFMLDKERMADHVGTELLARGIASLAIDLPLHGERLGAISALSIHTPFEAVRQWRAALDQSALALRYLSQRADLDSRRLSLVGYSLGAFLGLKVATREPSVRAVLLAAAGDLPDYIPFATIARSMADPLRLVARLGGRPLLMVHGRRDHTITPAQAERLFQAAREPKEIRWWDSGHVLPPAAIADAAAWLAAQMGGPRVGNREETEIRQ